MTEHELPEPDRDGSEISRSDLEELEKQLAGGLRFANLLGWASQETAQDSALLLHSLVEVLVSKGLIHLHELEKRKQTLIKSFGQDDEQTPKVYLVDAPDKYAQDPVHIDCASYHPICRAGCCTLWFALSVQDLDEGIAKWSYSHPYGIAQGPDGFCVHFDHASYRCSIYEKRPLVCRAYDCRADKRIWLDFEKGLLNPELASRLP